MAGLGKGVKMAAVFVAVGIAAGVGISMMIARSPELQQRVAEDGDAFDELSLEERAELLAYLSTGIQYKHRVAVGEESNFTGSAKGGSPPYQYEWQFSDGATYATQNVTRAFDSPGTYDGRFNVRDSAGDLKFSSFTIQVVE